MNSGDHYIKSECVDGWILEHWQDSNGVKYIVAVAPSDEGPCNNEGE